MNFKIVKPSEIPASWAQTLVGFDIETSEKSPFSDICLVSLYNPKENQGLVIGIKTVEGEIEPEELEILKKFLSNASVVGHNLQYDLVSIKYHWQVSPKVAHDTYLLARVRQMEEQSLKGLSVRFNPALANEVIRFDDIKPLIEDPCSPGHFSYDLKIPKIARYSAQDAILPFVILKGLKGKCEVDLPAYKIELEFLKVAVHMQTRGIALDSQVFDSIRESFIESRDRVQVDLNYMAGFNVRVNSTADKKRFLVDQLGVEPTLATKTGFSMSTEAMEMMLDNELERDPDSVRVSALKTVLNLSHLHSVSNNVKKLPEMLIQGGLHPTIEQIGYDGTSRVYSSNPSINQVPREFREALIPSPGYKFLYLDWTAAELYIQAYFANQEDLLRIFAEKKDPHRFVSGLILGREDISDEEREVSKVVTFASAYGSEGAAVSRALNCSQTRGEELVRRFFEVFPKIGELRRRVQSQTLKTTYTSTVYNRRRRLPLVKAESEFQVKKGLRQAFNTYVQGSCADFQKKSAIKALASGYDYVFGVFDSLLIQVPADWTDEQCKSICETLSDFSEDFPNFKFNFKYGVGFNWLEAMNQAH